MHARGTLVKSDSWQSDPSGSKGYVLPISLGDGAGSCELSSQTPHVYQEGLRQEVQLCAASFLTPGLGQAGGHPPGSSLRLGAHRGTVPSGSRHQWPCEQNKPGLRPISTNRAPGLALIFLEAHLTQLGQEAESPAP